MTDSINRLAEALAAVLADVAGQRPAAPPAAPVTWREKLWTAHGEVRLGVRELAEALGRPRSYVYRLTRQKQIPCRMLDGQLTFKVSDVRAWLGEHEDVLVTPRGRALR